jgi:Fic family protein
VPLDGVVEMANYFGALDHGLARLHQGFPLSNRLIREIHEVLLSRGRGGSKAPGELRRSQNWIGGSRPGNAAFVPPPPLLVPDCMAALERFLHAEGAGLAHVQFETIHPFLGGNGRVGRLLITLLLCHAGVLREPLLYLSLYFKQRRPRRDCAKATMFGPRQAFWRCIPRTATIGARFEPPSCPGHAEGRCGLDRPPGSIAMTKGTRAAMLPE